MAGKTSKKSAKVAKEAAARRVAAKAANPRKAIAKSSARKATKAAKPILLSASNPQIAKAIMRAEAFLPGRPAADGKRDPRWQAIIRVGEFIQSEPEAVLEFVLRWGRHSQRDLQAAIGTCLLEHLLESNFRELFPRVRDGALKNKNFARTFQMCSCFGEAKLPRNAAQVERLKRHLQRVHSK